MNFRQLPVNGKVVRRTATLALVGASLASPAIASADPSNGGPPAGSTITTVAQPRGQSTTATVTTPDKQHITVIVQQPAAQGNPALGLLLSFAPFLFIGGFIYYMSRRAQGATGPLSKMTKAGVIIDRPNVSFEDVAGVDEAKTELREVVDMLVNPAAYMRTGAITPKGVLLYGPPGTGKTLLAKAVAGHANATFFAISASQFVQMYVGVGAARVRDMINTARDNKPAIVFIDEFDSLAGHRARSAGMSGGNDEREQTLNQLLTAMDGFESNGQVIFIAATNRLEAIDEAALRSGRFDIKVPVGAPDLEGRVQILGVHGRGKPIADDVSLELLAKETPGMTGADLANVMNQGALLAARQNQTVITAEHLDEAVKRVVMGPEMRSRVLTSFELETVSYHEAGHALVGALTPGGDAVRSITIIPRGDSLGTTWSTADQEARLQTREQLFARLDMLMGGRAAEKLIHRDGLITTGASNDLEVATNLARVIVTQAGLSDLGDLAIPTIGRFGERLVSEETQSQIDGEVRRILFESSDRATKLLTDNRPLLDSVVKELRQRETLSGPQFDAIRAAQSGGPALT